MIKNLQICITIVIILFIGLIKITAQNEYSCITISKIDGVETSKGGITIDISHTGSVTNNGKALEVNCFNDNHTFRLPPNSIVLGADGSFSYTLEFNQKVNYVKFFITAAGSIGDQSFYFETDDGLPQLIETYGCNTSSEGNKLILGTSISESGGKFRIATSNGFYKLTVYGSGGFSGAEFGYCTIAAWDKKCDNEDLVPSVVESLCVDEYGTVVINEAHIGRVPENSELIWYTTEDRQPGTMVTTTSKVKSGTYYAFYRDIELDCFSQPSRSVLVKKCCSIIGSVPSVKESLCLDEDETTVIEYAHIGRIPENSEVIWYTTKDRKPGTMVTMTAMVKSGTYYAFYYDLKLDCFSQASKPVIVKKCCPVLDFVPSVKESLCIDDTSGRADLSKAHTGTLPLYTVLWWYTSSDRQPDTWVKDSSSVFPGVYYAFYYDPINDCYSKVSEAVIVKNCCSLHGAIPLVAGSLCVSSEGKANLSEAHTGTLPLYTVLRWYNTSDRQSDTWVNNPSSVFPGIYYAFYFDPINSCYSPSSSEAVIVKSCSCVKQPNITSKGVPSTIGITTQKYVNGWLESIPNGFLVLQSKEKGMVITRTTSSSILASGLVEGMLIYDTEEKCVKLYDGRVWKCIVRKHLCND